MRDTTRFFGKTFGMWQYITGNGWERLVKNCFKLSSYTCNSKSRENKFKNICYLKNFPYSAV